MMTKIGKLFLMALALVLALTPCSAELVDSMSAAGELAESSTNEDLQPVLLPLIDEGAAAAMAEDESLQGLYVGMRPVDLEVAEDGGTAVVIGDIYAAAGQLDTLTASQYGEVRWLDTFAVATLTHGADGWTLTDLSLDAEQDMADVAESYFADELTTYADTAAGWSIQYPSLLGDLTACADKDGCSGWGASAQDGKVTFFTGCRGNEKGTTLDALIAERRAAHPGLTEDHDEMTGVVRLQWTEGVTTTSELWIVTESTVYHASLTWDESLNAEIAPDLDPMMNSFCADELGIG